MSTLSFDLRGFEAKQTFPKEAKARTAGASFLIHAAFVSAMVLVPLLGSSILPEPVDPSNEILIQPISVALPPPPMPESRATHNSTRPPLTRALVIEIATPPNVPAALNLDTVPDPEIASSQQSGLGTEGPGPKSGGDCPLGTMCGDAALPLANPTTVEIPRVGGLIKEPRLIVSRSPQYPPIAQQAGVSGRVVVETHVGRDGLVKECRIVEGNRLFDEAALSSVHSRRYAPLLLNGVPSDFLVTITVAFNITR